MAITSSVLIRAVKLNTHFKIKTTLLIFGCLLTISCFSQTKLQKFNTTQFGLTVDQPFHSGSNFMHDNKGRLLFSDWSFDGLNFVQNPTKRKKLIKTESNGDRWYVEGQYNVSYETKDSTFEIYTSEYFDFPFVDVEIVGDDKYLLTNLGIIHFRSENGDLKHISNIPTEGEDNINIIHINDTLFIKKLSAQTFMTISNMGVEELANRKNLSNHNNEIHYLTNGRICLENEFENLVIHTDHPYHKTITKFTDDKIISKLIDSKERLWISIRDQGKTSLYFFDNSSKAELIDLPNSDISYITDIFEDMHGSIWIGTGGFGIIRIDQTSVKVLNKNAGLSVDNIWAIFQKQNGDILLSTSCNGIDIIRNDNQIDHIFGTGCSPTLLEDRNNNLWLANEGVRLIKNDGSKHLFGKSHGMMSRTVRTLLEDGKGRIWAGTRKGVHLFEGNKFKPFPVEGVEEFDRVLAMREYEEDKFIIGFVSGKIFTFSKGSYSPIPHHIKDLNTIYKDHANNIWICSQDEGLSIFKNGKIVKLDHEKLPESVKLLEEDKKGNLWGICEKNRIFRVKTEDILNQSSTLQIDYFGLTESIPLLATNNDVQPNSALLSDGRIIFPNIYGAILIDPEMVDKPIKSFASEYFTADTVFYDDLHLKYGNNDIEIKINTINIAPNRKISYQYFLNDTWNDVPDDLRMVFNNLPGGTNEINVRGRPFNGKWYDLKPIVIHVPVLWTESIWFWLFCALTLGTLIFIWGKWRIQTIKNRNEILSQKIKEQTLTIEEEKIQLSHALKKQKELTQELNLSQATKNRMYAQISHEFKSPLQAINAHLSKSQNFINPEDKNRIQGNIHNLLQISNEIMELSKAESGNLKIKKNYYNINGILSEQLELKLPLAEKKSINLTQKNTTPLYLQIDISLMQKVIGNLLSNAIKFSEEGKNINIESEIIGDKVQISITDEGHGIPPEELQNLTLAYYQASNNTKEGTGIGLSLVSEILKLHGSKLEVESTLNHGSKFYFSIPLPVLNQKEIIAKFEQSINTVSNGWIDPSRPLVLIVDDSPDILYFLQQSLSQSYSVLSASNGNAAINILTTNTPDLIISDQNMPIITGIQLLKSVRANAKTKAIPFMLLTGSLSEQTELLGIRTGADDIITKPVEVQLLLTKISTILKRQKTIESSIKTSFAHNLLPTNIHNDDLELMQRLEVVFIDQIENGKLKSEEIANIIGLGEKTLRNRVKTITGLTVKEYFKRFRLEKANFLLEEGYGTMGEVAIATGFSSLSYFSKSYKKYFEKK